MSVPLRTANGSDSLLGMLRARMQWTQARQGVIAENVANADMPGFRPRDLAELRFDTATGGGTAMGNGTGTGGGTRASGLTLTAANHIASTGQGGGSGGSGFETKRAMGFEVRPSGNGVNLEDEMMKAGDNQSDYQLAASLYQHSLTTLKIAIGKS